MSTRRTSVEAYNIIKEMGLLSKRRMEVYEALILNGNLTATQISNKMPGYKSQSVGANVHARLCELREFGVVEELGEVVCPMTNMTVILWGATNKLPEKKLRPTRTKCTVCDGRGYFEQERLL